MDAALQTLDLAETAAAAFHAAPGSAVCCVSAGCPKRKHAAQWLYDYPRLYFPMCDRARAALMKPAKDDPGLSGDAFTPLNTGEQATADRK